MYDKLKSLRQEDKLPAMKLWKKIERSRSLDEAKASLSSLEDWCYAEDSRTSFWDWAHMYLSNDWLLAATDTLHQDNYGLFYTNNACEASIRNFIVCGSKHIHLHQFLEHLIGALKLKERDLIRYDAG